MKKKVWKILTPIILISGSILGLFLFLWLFYEYYDQYEIAMSTNRAGKSFLHERICKYEYLESYYSKYDYLDCRKARSDKKQNAHYLAAKFTLMKIYKSLYPILEWIKDLWNSTKWIIYTIVTLMAIYGAFFMINYAKYVTTRPNITYMSLKPNPLGRGISYGKKIVRKFQRKNRKVKKVSNEYESDDYEE